MTFNLSYPKPESKREILISSVFVGILAYLFLLVFQPFGTNTISGLKLVRILFPYGIIVFSAFYSVNFFFLYKIREWNLGKELFKISIIIFLCTIFSYFYNTLMINKTELSFRKFTFMFLYTVSIAVPVYSVYILTKFIYLNNKNQRSALELSRNITLASGTGRINNEDQIRVNDFTVKENDLYFIESTDNYCTFYYRNNSEIKSILLRTTLKSTLEQIKSRNIIRCHYSYIVNLKKVKQIKGNAQGYKLKFENTGLEVSVSRKYIEAVRRALTDGNLSLTDTTFS